MEEDLVPIDYKWKAERNGIKYLTGTIKNNSNRHYLQYK